MSTPLLPRPSYHQHHQHHLGLLRPVPVPAPAPRATRPVSAEESAHITRLLGALLNVEASARYLESVANLTGQLRQDIRQVRKAGQAANARMLKEFSPDDSAALDTLNRAGNLLDRLTILLVHCPPDVAEAAANAAADTVQAWANTVQPLPL